MPNKNKESDILENLLLLIFPLVGFFVLLYLFGVLTVNKEKLIPTKHEEKKEINDKSQRLQIESDNFPGQNFTSLEFAKQFTC